MAEYSENDAGLARQIVESLFVREQKEVGIPDNLPISDVEEDTEEFRNDLLFLEDLGINRVPAIRIENSALVPMALSLSDSRMSDLFPIRMQRMMRRYFYDYK